MGLLDSLFGDQKSNLKQMLSDTNVIQMAVALKLVSLYEPKYGDERGYDLAGHTANKLFGTISTGHTEDLQLAEQFALQLLNDDNEIRYAALMACRARLLCGLEKNNEIRTWDTIQWMSTIWTLPPDVASPSLIRNIAIALQSKYWTK